MAFKLRESGRLQFFQSSLPYLNNNAVTKFSRNHPRHWRSDEPHPSNHRFLSIANGHYGIYFTILNHELRREEKAGLHDNSSHILLVLPSSSSSPLLIPYFVISKVKDEVYSHINQLKDVSRELLSSWALVRPKNALQQPQLIRHFSTTARELDQEHPRITPLSKPQVEEIVEEKVAEEPPFEHSFQRTQCDKIVQIYNTHASPEELNIIYPLYQSLKRNSIPLLSIQHYNIILEAILRRPLDNDSASLTDIESRLTTLLTVYQDILNLCSTTSLRPDKTTYDLVLTGIFDGCIQALHSRSPSMVKHLDDEFSAKAFEFCQVGVNLFLSLKDHKTLSLTSILPSMLSALTSFPQLINKELISVILQNRDLESDNGSYYVGMINISKHFNALEVAGMDKQSVYQYIVSVFDDYKRASQTLPGLLNSEYDVYSALISALIANGNLPLATKFLDDILLDYKSSLQAYAKDIGFAKRKVSSLLSVYVEAIMEGGAKKDVFKAYGLLEKFNKVSYLPELSISVYTQLISRFINEYATMEMTRRTTDDEKTLRAQKAMYETIWKLYDRIAIRSDFAEVPTSEILSAKRESSSIELLLSFSIDLNDHEKSLRLIKEILAKDHKLREWNNSKKMVLYLISCAQRTHNDEYIELCWSFLEQQAALCFESSSVLNGFVSEHLPYLSQISTERNLSHIINSPMLEKAFSEFELANDNIFGLMCATNYLFNYSSIRHFNSNEMSRILRYHAFLIREFEDPENHYLQISEDIEIFKANVKSSFTRLMSSVSTSENMDPAVAEAYNMLELENLSNEFAMEDSRARIDLSHLLSIQFREGNNRFIQAFNSGYQFSALTWKIVINQNFVTETLAHDKVVRIKDFLTRLLSSTMEVSEKHALISQLINLCNEKVNIEAFKVLRDVDRTGALCNSRVLDALASFAAISNNKYLLAMIEAVFGDLLAGNDNNRWVYKMLNKFMEAGMAENAFKRISSERLQTLNLTAQDDVELICSALTFLINARKDDDVSALMKHYFMGPEGNELLLQSEKILKILIDFYTVRGNYQIVIDRFGEFADRSPSLEGAIGFSKFMLQVSGQDVVETEPRESSNIDNFALDLLAAGNSRGMYALGQSNERFLKAKADLFDTMISHLSRASNLASPKSRSTISHIFEEVIKFCKRIRMRELTTQNLVNVIRLLSAMKSRESLNILFNKFINREQTASIINFYFLNFTVTSSHEVNLLRKEFERALREVGDDINLLTLANTA